jgi:hypothetical protein
MNKYTREITQTLADEDQGFTISVDVYDVLRAFNVTDPAIQHAVKKLLCTGIRGHKDSRQDLEEAIQSIERALDIVKVEEKLAEPIDAEFEVVAESQPVTSDNPQDSPVCPWRFGDVIRHRHRPTDFDWTIAEITPRGIECRTGDRGETSMFIPVASYEHYDLRNKVKAHQQSDCPFKVGDVIQHYDTNTSKTKWKITHISDGKLLVTSYDPYQTPSWIELQFWCNYRVVEQVETAAQEPQSCPFKVGDVIQSIKWPDYVFRVYEVSKDAFMADNVAAGSRHTIARVNWGSYRLKSETGVDKPAATC